MPRRDPTGARPGAPAPRPRATTPPSRPLVPLALLALLAATVAGGAARATAVGVPGCNGPVRATLVHDGVLYVGGEFTTAGGVTVNGIAAWDGVAWSPLGSGVDGAQVYEDQYGERVEIPPQVDCLTFFDGQLIAGGSFTVAGGVAAASVARWDGAAWHPLAGGMPEPLRYYLFGSLAYVFPPSVQTLAVWQDDLYAGGVFATAGDSTASAVARWDGSVWHPLGGGVGGRTPPRVLALAPLADRLIVAGDFRVAGSVLSERIATWDGATWAPIAPTGPEAAVCALLARGDSLFVGGEFSLLGDLPAAHLGLWDGQTWQTVGGDGPPNPVHCLLDHEGQLYAGAWVRRLGGWYNRLQTDGPVLALAPWQDRLVFGGDFHTIAGRVGWNVDVWPAAPTAVAPGGAVPAARLTGLAPNPANPAVRIHLELSEPADVRLTILDARGRLVAVPLAESLPAGGHSVLWRGRGDDGRPVPSGVYLAVLEGPDGRDMRKLVIQQ